MSRLVIKQGLKAAVKSRIRGVIGKIASIIYHAFKFHELVYNDPRYQFTGSRLSKGQIKRCGSYFDEKINSYKQEQMEVKNIEKLSEYYHFQKIEENEVAPLKSRICNIGCFYCGADKHFLEKHPGCEVYGLDFDGVVEANRNIHSEKLKLFSGYPLETLENENFGVFDYVLFTRTATLINIKQLLSYMEVLQKLAKNICFLEVVKISSYTKRVLDIEKIDMMNPIRMYAGMYIHNYPEILKKYGYGIIASSILSPDIFDQALTSDHYFIYTHGKNKSLGEVRSVR